MHWMQLNVLLAKPNEEPAPSPFSLSINIILYYSIFPLLSFFLFSPLHSKKKIELSGVSQCWVWQTCSFEMKSWDFCFSCSTSSLSQYDPVSIFLPTSFFFLFSPTHLKKNGTFCGGCGKSALLKWKFEIFSLIAQSPLSQYDHVSSFPLLFVPSFLSHPLKKNGTFFVGYGKSALYEMKSWNFCFPLLCTESVTTGGGCDFCGFYHRPGWYAWFHEGYLKCRLLYTLYLFIYLFYCFWCIIWGCS